MGIKYSLTEMARNRRVDLIMDEIDKKQKILDLGCGSGWFVDFLRKKGYNCFGCDINLRGRKPNKFFKKGSAYKMPFKDNSFDCIVSMEVLEHVDTSSYKEIKRVLKKGGKLIVTTPYPWSEFFLQIMRRLKLIRWVTAEESQHINPIKVDKMPFKLKRKETILIFDQYAVYKN